MVQVRFFLVLIKFNNCFLVGRILLKNSKYKPRLITIVLILNKYLILIMEIMKIQLLFKTSDLLLFIKIYNNKRFKQSGSLVFNYKVKISVLVLLHLYSIKKRVLIPFIKSTGFFIFYGFQLYKELINIVLMHNSTTYYSIKFNNNLYPMFIIKSSYSFSYYQVQRFLYKTLSNIIKQPVKIM